MVVIVRTLSLTIIFFIVGTGVLLLLLCDVDEFEQSASRMWTVV